MLIVRVKYCFPYETSGYMYIKFENGKLEYLKEEKDATDFEEQTKLQEFFIYLLQNKKEVQIQNSMFMHFVGVNIVNHCRSFNDKLELVYS